jgi:hypothetical protein
MTGSEPCASRAAALLWSCGHRLDSIQMELKPSIRVALNQSDAMPVWRVNNLLLGQISETVLRDTCFGRNFYEAQAGFQKVTHDEAEQRGLSLFGDRLAAIGALHTAARS